MKKKMASRVISMLLISVMLFTMTGVSAFAEDQYGKPKEETNLLVFGASTSSGYGLSDFVNNRCGFAPENDDLYDKDDNPDGVWTVDAARDAKRGRISNSSYPWQLKKHIAKTKYNGDLSKVNLNSLALNGMRTDEVRAMLDKDYYLKVDRIEKEKTWRYAENGDVLYCGFMGEHIDSFGCDLSAAGATVNGQPIRKDEDDTILPGGRHGVYVSMDYQVSENYNRLHEYVKQEIEKADVIVVDVAMNNFGTYLAERVAGYAKTPGYESKFGYYKQTLDDIDGVSDRTWSALKVLENDLLTKTDYLQSETAKQFVDSFLFCYADCVTNFSAIVEKIREINPSAKIIAQGVYNTLDGVKLIVDGQEIDFGALSAEGFKLVNAYIKGLDKNSPNYYYSDVSSGIETFMNQIVLSDAENVQDFMAADVENKSLMDNFYGSFNSDFMGGAGDLFVYPADTVYQYMLVSNFVGNNIALPIWDDMNDDDKIVGTTYVSALGPTLNKNDALTKQTLIGLACQQAGVDPANFDYLPQENQEDIVAGAKDYYENTIVPQYEAGGVGPKNWDDLSLTEEITAKAYVTMDTTADSIADAIKPQPTDDVKNVKYLTKKNFTEFSENVVPNIYQLLYDAAKYTTIDLDRLFVSMGDMGKVNAEIQRFMMTGEQPSAETMELLHIVDRFMLYMGLGQHPSKKGVETMADDVIAAYDKLANGGYTAFEEVFEKYYPYLIGVGLKIKEAYDNGDIDKLMTIYSRLDEISELMSVIDEEGLTADQLKNLFKMKEELSDDMSKVLEYFGLTIDDVYEMMHETANDPEKMEEIIEKINKIDSAIDMLDEAQASMDDLKQLMEIKEKFIEVYGEALDLLGIETEDLINQGKFIVDHVDAEKIAEMLKQMNDIIERWPELRAKYEPIIRENIELIYDVINTAIDEYNKIMDSVDIEKLADFIRTAKEIVGVLDGIYNADSLEEKLDMLQEILVDRAGLMSDDLYNQIKEIALRLSEELEGKDFQEIVEELKPIFEQLQEIGLAVYNLPEYEKAMDAYSELLDQFAAEAADLKDEVAGLKDQVDALQQVQDEQIDLIAKLKAKSISADLKTKVTFPSGKVRVTVSWDKDEDASGYVLKVNGEVKEFAETATGYEYVENAKIGKTYKFEVTPNASYKSLAAEGRTFKASVTPKVTLKKAKIKKVKPAKKALKVSWKKVANADGYRVYYKRAGKKAQYKTVKGLKTLKKTLKKLTSNKQYKVKVQAWKKVDGKKYFGKWSKAKKIVVK